MNHKPTLTDQDHEDMEAFLSHVLDDYKAGKLDKMKAIAELAHVMAALDLDNYGEVRACFAQGRNW
ncbi:hypothetical protein ACUZ8Y_22905 [Aeromonas veronii]|uniref:hypothetical protein n=1 Tax=Aeromonas veronii TaxID=654 RepID=UPI00406BD9E1